MQKKTCVNKTRAVRMSDETVAILEMIGNGSLSSGIRTVISMLSHEQLSAVVQAKKNEVAKIGEAIEKMSL